MKTVELEPSLIEDIKALLADEEMREKFLRTISRLKAKLTKQREAEAQEHKMKPYIVEGLEAEIADFAAEGVVQEPRESYGRMPAQAEKLTPYTMEEINERIDKAEADIAAGRVISSEEMHRRMRNYLSTL